MSQKVTVYSADSQIKDIRSVFLDMFRGVRDSGYVAFRLTKKDIRSQYAKTAFGMAWDLLDPLVIGGIFYILMRVRVIDPGNLGMPYAVFVTYGVLLYATLTESIQMPLSIFSRSKGLLQHVNVAPEAYIMSVLFRIGFNSLFRVAVMFAFSVFLVDNFSILGFLGFVLCYPLIILAGMSIGILLAPFNTIFTDLGRFVQIILRPLRYLSPVMWLIPASGTAALLNTYNPVSVYIMNLRDLANKNALYDPAALASWSGISLVVFLIGWLIFHLSVPVLSERA